MVPLGDAQGVQAPRQEASFASSTILPSYWGNWCPAPPPPRALPWQEERSGGSHTSPASPEEGEMPGPLSGFLCLCLTARPKGTKPHTPCQRGTWEPGTFPGSRGALMGLGGKVWGGFPLEQQFPLYLSSSLIQTLLGLYQS